jgi:hypothetical protein
MVAANSNTALVETPSAQLAKAVTGLEPGKAAAVRGAFEPMLACVEEWEREAAGLVVTDETQVPKMKRARLLRLEIRSKRVDLEKARKAMKAQVLLEGRVTDAAFHIFEGLAEPLEKRLLEQETFAERAAKGREDSLAMARAEVLLALGVRREALPAGLGRLTEDVWGPILEDARIAKEAREQKARDEEAARVEAERILREKREAEKAEAQAREAERIAREGAARAEAARLKAELDAKDAEHRAERARVEEEQRLARQKHEAELAEQRHAAAAREAELRAEREAHERARVAELAQEREAREAAEHEAKAAADREHIRELAEKRRQAEEQKAREQAELAPDREKLAAFAEQLRELTLRLEQPKAQELWQKVRQRLAKLASDIEAAAGQM